MKITWGDVAVVVNDAQESAKWWKQKCGFEIRDRMGHWVTVAPPGSTGIVLHLCKNGTREEGNTGIGFYVDDVAAIEKAWTAKGVKFTRSTTQGEASISAMFADIDGNEYWLFEDDDLKAPKKAAARKAPARKPAQKAKTQKKR